MRELKFRAWNGKEMKPAFDLTQNPKFWWEENKDYPLMQFTGLKDKNGKEIYEGDIVKLHQFLFDGFSEVEREIVGEISYQESVCSFALAKTNNKNIKEYMGYEENEDVGPLPIFLFHGIHEESFEVIGNIYENPEMLEGESNV